MIRRVLCGGTAGGKKTLALALARRHGLRLLAMDSMKVYRGMDIGTDKPHPADRAEPCFGLLDLVDHSESFSAGRWVVAAAEEVAQARGPVLFVGGTALYLRLLLRGLFQGPASDPEQRCALERWWSEAGEAALRAELARVDPALESRLLPGDKKRLLRGLEVYRLSGRPLSDWQTNETRCPIAGRFVVAALRHDPARHAERIRQRARIMLERGLVAEVAALAERAPFAPEPARAIGYAEVLEQLAGSMGPDDVMRRIVERTRQLVRKQRGFIAAHHEVRWVDVPPQGGPLAVLPELEAALELPAR